MLLFLIRCLTAEANENEDLNLYVSFLAHNEIPVSGGCGCYYLLIN